jgi:short-subunit dehydrogenase
MPEHRTRKVTIVTGASFGIDEALALARAAQDTHVVQVARSVERLTALAMRIASPGGRATGGRAPSRSTPSQFSSVAVEA